MPENERSQDMKQAILFALTVGLLGVGVVVGQRTVTNADLDKYRIQREAAERDYRENYEKMGFPSPEELQRQLEESRLENDRMLERWSQERIELAKAEAMKAQAQPSMPTVVTIPVPSEYPNENYNEVYGYGQPYYTYGNRFPPFGNRYWRRGYRQQSPSGYVSGGTYWPGSAPAGRRIRTTTTPRQ